MYPHPHSYPSPYSGWPHPMYPFRRGPRRFVWFIFGGLAATMWLKCKERERRSIEWFGDRPHGSWWNFGSRGEGKPINSASAEKWKEERERIAQLGSQATDTVADVSESALDSILTTAEMLKKKLAENRLRRQNAEEQRKTDSRADSDPPHRV